MSVPLDGGLFRRDDTSKCRPIASAGQEKSEQSLTSNGKRDRKMSRSPATPQRRGVMALATMLFCSTVAGTAMAQKPTPASPPPAPAAPRDEAAEKGVDGFRSAHFGMTEAQVRAAIRTDFKIADSAIKSKTHPVEQTRVLEIVVRDLVVQGTEANIAYVLGFRSKALVQVNVLWRAADAAGAEVVIGIANAIRDLFVSQVSSGRFKKETITVNTALPDGRVVVFRGADEKRQAVELVLAAAQSGGPAAAKTGHQVVGAQLRLMYIQSPENPDINRLKPGQF
jgi:hypothetical protein